MTENLSPVQEHQRGGGPEPEEAAARPGKRRLPEEEGTGQDAAREGKAVQAGKERQGKETNAERGTKKINLESDRVL